MNNSGRKVAGTAFALALVASACGGGVDVGVAGQTLDADAPTVAVTTNILGDVVENLVGDQMNVEVIMPVGADPHDFQASAQQVAAMGDADVLITNGAAFEEGLLDVIETAEDDGALVYEAIAAVTTLEFAEGDSHEHEHEHEHEEHEDEEHEDEEHEDEEHEDEEHEDEEHEDEEHEDEEHEDEEHEDEEHEDEEHEDEDEHGHEDGVDPHFFTDPARVALAVDGIADFLAENVEGIDTEALATAADDYVGELVALDSEVEETLSSIDAGDRILITNHEVFGYFADRYDFEVVGTVIPATSTGDGVSAQELAELAEVIEHEGVSAIFADTSSSNELADTLAAEVGEVTVIDLFTESLGAADSDGATYVDMVRANADRIVSALGA